MGYRLHVAKVYKVEYALGDAFSHKSEEFHNLLSACGVDYTGDDCDSDFEVGKDEWRKLIDRLRSFDNMDNPDEKYEIEVCIRDLESSTTEVVSMLEYYLENCDPNNDYLHLSYF